MKTRNTLGIFAALAPISSASADLVVTDVIRDASATIEYEDAFGPGGGGDYSDNHEQGIWDYTAEVILGGGFILGEARAIQSSDVHIDGNDAATFSTVLAAIFDVDYDPSEVFPIQMNASTHYWVSFTIDMESSWTLEGFVAATTSSVGAASYELFRTDAGIELISALSVDPFEGNQGTYDIDEGGVLPPGEYYFQATAETYDLGEPSMYGESGVDLELKINPLSVPVDAVSWSDVKGSFGQ